MISITIPGKPIAQARPRFARRGKFVTTYNPQETEAGKFLLLVKAQLPNGFVPLDGPLAVECLFSMPIPASKSKRVQDAMVRGDVLHTCKPDCSNLVKFVEDCLNGVVWVDDSQIVSLGAAKDYSWSPGTTITVSTMPEYLPEKKSRQIVSQEA